MDLINGLFQLGGCLMAWVNVRATWQDQRLLCVRVWTICFFNTWNLWNLWYYRPIWGVWSYLGGTLLAVGNTTWIVLICYVRNKRPTKEK